MLFQISILPANHTSDDITHTVVVANLFMLIPRGIFSSLCTPLSSSVSIFKIVRQQTSTGRTRNDFVAVIANSTIITKATTLLAINRCTHGFGSIFNQKRTVLLAYSLDLIHPSGESI